MQEARLLEKLAKQGSLLSEKRKSAAVEMGSSIEAELDDLRMESAQFGVDFQTKPDPNGAPIEDGTRIAFDQNGFDRVEFLIAPNPGAYSMALPGHNGPVWGVTISSDDQWFITASQDGNARLWQPVALSDVLRSACRTARSWFATSCPTPWWPPSLLRRRYRLP